MADKKPTKNMAAQKAEKAESKYTKSRLLAAERFREKQDAVNAVLAEYPDDAMFTVKTVEQKIENYLKGQVN